MLKNLTATRKDLEQPEIDDDALFYELFIDPAGRDSGYSFKAAVTAKYDDGNTVLYQGRFSSHDLVCNLLCNIVGLLQEITYITLRCYISGMVPSMPGH